MRLHRQKFHQLANEQLSQIDALYLDLSRNGLKFLPEKVNGIKNINWLNLRHNFFTDFPPAQYQFNHLRGLDLGYNQLEQLNPALSFLKELKFLDIQANSLLSFPDENCFPPNLIYLNLAFNPGLDLTSLFEHLLRLPGPLHINISGCALHRLPDSISYLHQLRTLGVSDNPSLDLNHTLEKLESLPRLEFLDLSNTSKSLPARMAHLKNLKGLKYNHFSYKEPLPSWLPQLEYLDLSHNHWHKIPEWIGRLKNLKTLHLSHNRLEQIPPRISEKLPQLKKLDLSFNAIQHYPSHLSHLIAKLDELKINGNPGSFQKLLRQFLKVIQTCPLTEPQKEMASLIVLGDLECAFRNAQRKDLMALLATRLPVLCYAVLHFIENKVCTSPSLLKEGDTISSTGSSTRFRLVDIRKPLKKKGIKLISSTEASPDYFLITPFPKSHWRLPAGGKLITDTQLKDSVKSELCEASIREPKTAQIRNLLQSPEENNQW
ncbi:MAG: leucine-rich repeat domain-containing protein, partial [Bacteroidota bacterium]